MAIDNNLRTLHWGRAAAHDLALIEKLVAPFDRETDRFHAKNLDEAQSYREHFLENYQDKKLAARYRAMVEDVRAAEHKIGADHQALTKAVIHNYFKLLAYKDEYEVARLYASGDFENRLKAQFEGDVRLSFHMAPPLFSKIDPRTGRPKKTEFGPWMLPAFRLLAKLKGLRGTPFDPFGYSADRKMERQLIADYEAMLARILPRLRADNLDCATALAALPDMVRGFGPVKEDSVELMLKKKAELLDRFNDPTIKNPEIMAAQ
nr:DUF6537 domain-containing protein [Iodidimonas nitroreducens]